MIKLTLKIKNYSGVKALNFTLFNVLYNSININSLPKEVEITAFVKRPKEPPYEIKYEQFLLQISVDPNMVNVVKSTNNRQLDFFRHDKKALMFGGKTLIDMEPGLTINRKPRPEKRVKRISDTDEHEVWYERVYVKKWDPKKWNIADTQEPFILDNLVGVNINLLPNQEFELILNLHPKLDVNKMLLEYKPKF